MSKFIREERYAVLKISDVNEALTVEECEQLIELEKKVQTCRELLGKKALDCVVVESDWPEYEPTWKSIENRSMGLSSEFFVYCPNSGFETFSSTEERDAHAEECVQGYLDDGWSEEVTQVCAGIITHEATQVDRVDRPDDIDQNSCDGLGAYWADEWDHKCNYKLLPIGSTKERVA